VMNGPLSGFYSRLYRCEDCKEIRNPRGVYYFVNGKGTPRSPEYLPPTIPVSHFGDIAHSKIWVVTTNPKGDREDPLVGLNVHKFGVRSRTHLTESDINSIFEIQCDYFRDSNSKWHPFFSTFVKLLDGIRLGQQSLNCRSGDVCFVDAIKCPTEIAWGSFVRSDEGKQVWNNCLRFQNKFLSRQLELHKPRIVLYYGTGSLIKVSQKGKKVGESTRFSNGLKLQTRHLYYKGRLERISIEFSKANLDLSQNELIDIRNYLSKYFEIVNLKGLSCP